MKGIKAVIGVYRDRGPKGGTTEVQSVLFPIKYARTHVKNWLKDHGFKHNYIEESKSYWRARQLDPDQFIRMRTISFNPGAAWHEGEEKYYSKLIRSAKDQIGSTYFEGKRDAHRHSKEVSRALKINPQMKSQIVDKIYDKILAIEAQKGNDSLWPRENFRHSFKEGAEIYGLKDGSLLVVGKKGKKLWKRINYD